MLARAVTHALVGLEARRVEVEADVHETGLPAFAIVGLPDRAWGKHASMLMELRSLSVERRDLVITRREEYESVVEGILRDGQDDGVIRSDAPARLLALGLLNLLNWTIFWFQPSGRLTSVQIAEIFTNLYLDGAAVRDDAGGPVGNPAKRTPVGKTTRRD